MPGGYDSAPAWSPDGRRIAFESNADVAGANPEGDMEIWTMAADGTSARQLTRNALHDEGPAWSPDGGRLLAYTSGPDDAHGDIHVMTAAAAPAPADDVRGPRRVARLAGDPGAEDDAALRRRRPQRPGARDVRASGHGLHVRHRAGARAPLVDAASRARSASSPSR